MTAIKHVCEVCGKEEILESEEAYKSGWDYPPFMGTWGIISPRTCPDCNITQTVWWDITINNKTYNDLNDHQKEVVNRIAEEKEWYTKDQKTE